MIHDVALCGVFAALAVVFLMIGGDTLVDLSILLVCALMTMILVVETGRRAVLIYAAVTSVLAAILLPNKLYAIEYFLFSAAYPLVKLAFEKYRAFLAWPLKLSYLDLCLLGCILLAKYVFMLEDKMYELTFVTIALGTAVFVIFDLCLTACITLYLVKLRKLIHRDR